MSLLTLFNKLLGHLTLDVFQIPTIDILSSPSRSHIVSNWNASTKFWALYSFFHMVVCSIRFLSDTFLCMSINWMIDLNQKHVTCFYLDHNFSKENTLECILSTCSIVCHNFIDVNLCLKMLPYATMQYQSSTTKQSCIRRYF